MEGLTDDDAVNLWRAFGVTGSRRELVALFNTFGNYPLLIRALAGEVARYRPAPRDFDKWRQAHAEFDPYRLPLVQRKSHILQYALRGLTDAERSALYTIAAFRAPATYDTLAALMVGLDKPCADEVMLDVVLSDLEDRGLVGWDRRGNRYDLHPVVRGVAWSGLDPNSKQDIYQNLASYFEALPQMDDNAIKSIDDLAGAIELYHTLIQLNRAEDAIDILQDRIIDPIGDRIWEFHQLAELIELFITKSALMEQIKDEDAEDSADLITVLAICYYYCGDPIRGLDVLTKIDVDSTANDYDVGVRLALHSGLLCQMGALAEAERQARASVNTANQKQQRTSQIGLGLEALAIIFIVRGEYEKARAWLSDYRVKIRNDDPDGEMSVMSECGLACLRQGDIDSAQALAEQMEAISEEPVMPHFRIAAMIIYAAIAEARGERDQAHDILNDALVLAREARFLDSEADLLVQLGHWNVRSGYLDTARRYSFEALHIAEHRQLKLRQIDAINLLSSIEHASGNQHKAANAAAEAFRLAWCDGPPYVYDWGIRQARDNLAAAERPEPADLPVLNSPSQMPEVAVMPISLITALTVQPPLETLVLKQVIRLLPKCDDSVAALRTFRDSAATLPEIREVAIDRLVKLDEDSGRV